jgi:hypothetical protein
MTSMWDEVILVELKSKLKHLLCRFKLNDDFLLFLMDYKIKKRFVHFQFFENQKRIGSQ